MFSIRLSLDVSGDLKFFCNQASVTGFTVRGTHLLDIWFPEEQYNPRLNLNASLTTRQTVELILSKGVNSSSLGNYKTNDHLVDCCDCRTLIIKLSVLNSNII